ncbi:hypothetical protein G4B88_003569 [Cannabis sativa]|uniref:non-specific serine/threonine protein kinase n=1 Tax=Cannabis sativa TaxID=3483 RepID=A0A7J6EPE6_CANSA|nr:hypothetical protein G4B88_003569 [Cannabis sativa]
MISLISSISTSTKNSYWLSNSGQFGFGFYKQGNGFSIGIWFDNIKEKTVVWTWNRDQQQPLPQSTTLVLNDFANFVSPDQPAASASMLDSGNFVLYNSDSKIIWQSFENPTDTLLSGSIATGISNGIRVTIEFYEVLWENNYYSIVPKNSRIACEQDCLKDCQCEIAMYTSNTCDKLRLPLRYAKVDQRNSDVVTMVKVLSQSSEATTTWVTKGRSERVRNRFLISSVNSPQKSGSSVGYCHENSNRLLVYDYMRHGSLSNFLFKSETKPHWNDRVKIALGIARGILYLHEDCENKIIHCDINPNNILIDENRDVKIADFGLTKLLMPDQTRTHTRIRGTKGFVAPEWHKGQPITTKADVYIIGIVLLVIICCRPSVDVSVPQEEAILVDWDLVYTSRANNSSSYEEGSGHGGRNSSYSYSSMHSFLQ